MPDFRIVNKLQPDAPAEMRDLMQGLLDIRAHIDPKYFYDDLGCTLYAAICQLEEYYPTRTERSIFQQFRQEIVDAIGEVGTFVDLGAGDCCKAQGWLPFIAPRRYLAVDIAGAALETALSNMAPEFPDTEMIGLVTDFSRSFDVPGELLTGRVTVFFPGSSIGNFTPDSAIHLLRAIRRVASDGGLLIGVDAKKGKARLDAAYADELGVTAAFNINALRHINRLTGSNFQEKNWRHVGAYNETAGRVEMHLESIKEQIVMLDGSPRVFRPGERIHSENSYKYGREEFVAMLKAAGFRDVKIWSDDAQDFWVMYAN